VNAQTSRTHTVKRILLDGKDVASADYVIVTPTSANAQTTIHRGETIADGTRIEVPEHVVVARTPTRCNPRAGACDLSADLRARDQRAARDGQHRASEHSAAWGWERVS